ncbi:MAG: hypothetical protein M1839_001756 [Geoglossum umbratile]|nr:MAG: hypothetical protein M1839_001756 [Geoglossum umbratile]
MKAVEGGGAGKPLWRLEIPAVVKDDGQTKLAPPNYRNYSANLASDFTLLCETTSSTPQNDMQTGNEVEVTGLSETSEDVADRLSSEFPEPTDRPNKYGGPPSTWRSWTEAERRLAASLDQERATDLAIHLYNSHALKRRLRQPKDGDARTGQGWGGREGRFLPQGRLGSESVGDGQDAFCPQKGWTAWPMRPELVPREEQGISWLSTHEVKGSVGHQTGRKVASPKPSEVLEDCIFAGILNIAKEKYQERVNDPSQRYCEDKSDPPSSDGMETVVPSLTKADEAMADDPTIIGGHERRDGSISEDSEVSYHPSFPYPALVPIADDERAHTLLQPIARHLLSKFDSLLMGLHYAREAYLPSSDEKILKRAQEGELPLNLGRKNPLRKPTKRGRGRPPKNPQAHTTSADPGIQDDAQPSNAVVSSGGQKRRVGRPRKYSRGLEDNRKLVKDPESKAGLSLDLAEGESASDYTAESESESSSQHSGSTSETLPPSIRCGITGDPATKAGYRVKRQGQLGLRDWSDVLGIASMVGWDPETISRAAARCSTLFGEGISFRTLAEGETFLGNGRIVEYRPNMISPTAGEGNHARPRFSGREIKPERDYPPYIQERINSVRLEETKPNGQWSPAEDELLCNLRSTWPLAWSEIAVHFPNRSAIACESRWHRLREEPESAKQQPELRAKSDKRKERNDITDLEEYHMVGGVHNDGFLEPIKARGGWRGADQVKRRRKWKAKPDIEDSG